MTLLTNNTVGYYSQDECNIDEFTTLIQQVLTSEQLQYATDVQKNIPIYDVSMLQPLLTDNNTKKLLMAEWAEILNHSAGIVVLKNAYEDTQVIDDATNIFKQIITQEKEQNGGGSDHFATAGINDRIWNTQQKLCENSPQTFVKYFANPAIDAICEAWLGPNYQMTSQVNVVYPGGAAQEPHRDYHLGFQTSEICATYPAHVHSLSPLMTLQGGIAHIDMPIESGPTKLLPFSQMYQPGYTAWRRDDFKACFEQHYVQLPLAKGDAFFFNPALFHAAGENTSKDIERMANLLQISSAFGRSTETVDRQKMCSLVYPYLLERINKRTFNEAQLHAIISATAEGYSFPTNLDRDPPIGGLAPESQHGLFVRALEKKWTLEQLNQSLNKQSTVKLS
jgi:ectoine hydroxylase-related dioxygenase (phytanoyl-CoA dioxygenase family)